MIKIKRWIAYDDAKAMSEAPISGLGGWFREGHRWPNYLEAIEPEALPYAEALRAEVLERKLKTTGADHQYASDGVPVFSDGTVGLFSYRAWGDLMAAIWSTAEDRDSHYMEFYM